GQDLGARPADEAPFALGGSWEYRWAESAEKAREAEGAWLPYSHYPSTPPDRRGRRFLSVRTSLPPGRFSDPALFFDRIYLLAEFYLDGRLIHSTGQLESEEDEEHFAGLQAHIVHLPQAWAGKELRVVFRSEYQVIGIKKRVWIGNRDDLVAKILADDMDRLVLFVLFVAAGLISFFIQRRPLAHSGSGSFGFASIGAGFHTLYYSSVKQFLFGSPLFWNYVWIISTATMIVSILIFSSWVNPKRFPRLARGLGAFHIAYAVATAMAFGAKDYDLAGLLSTWRLALYAVEFVTALSMILPGIFRGHGESRLIALGLGGAALVMGWDLFAASQVVPLYTFGSHWGFLILLFCMGWVLIQRLLGALRVAAAHQSELERARFAERERIYADLHDHLGSALNDLVIASRQGLEGTRRPEEALGAVNAGLVSSYKQLRERLDSLEEEDLIRKDFAQALQLALLRRYRSAGRLVKFQAPQAARQAFQDLLDDGRRLQLFSAAEEIATNDLKHGSGTSSWYLESGSVGGRPFAVLSMSAASSYDPETAVPGRGERNLMLRLRNCGALVESAGLQGSVYRIRIKLYG
ncbi:MAG TPA: hypothetical protein VIO60_00270, partial [Rectinemataceae bacterium]